MEETRFKETLGRGLKILVDEVEGMGEGGTLAVQRPLSSMFYGFPLDLTQDVMRGSTGKSILTVSMLPWKNRKPRRARPGRFRR